MGQVFFTSDLHLGHRLAARLRGFSSVEAHDQFLIDQINLEVNKKDKLWILGDVAFTLTGLEKLSQIKCQFLDLVLGNHDLFPTQIYLRYFKHLYGIKKYEEFWLTHCPIIENEIRGNRINLHGHIHAKAATDNPVGRYYNVSVDFNEMTPISLKELRRENSEGHF